MLVDRDRHVALADGHRAQGPGVGLGRECGRSKRDEQPPSPCLSDPWMLHGVAPLMSPTRRRLVETGAGGSRAMTRWCDGDALLTTGEPLMGQRGSQSDSVATGRRHVDSLRRA
jgi:hypothetical protein